MNIPAIENTVIDRMDRKNYSIFASKRGAKLSSTDLDKLLVCGMKLEKIGKEIQDRIKYVTDPRENGIDDYFVESTGDIILDNLIIFLNTCGHTLNELLEDRIHGK